VIVGYNTCGAVSSLAEVEGLTCLYLSWQGRGPTEAGPPSDGEGSPLSLNLVTLAVCLIDDEVSHISHRCRQPYLHDALEKALISKGRTSHNTKRVRT
jgi:hypothetical protein